MNLLHILYCTATFSFLSSAAYLAVVRIPNPHKWKRLGICRRLLIGIFLIVGMAVGKNIIWTDIAHPEIIATSVFVSASLQSMLFMVTSMTFLNPTAVTRKFLLGNAAVYALADIQLLAALLLWREWFWYSALVSAAVQLGMVTYYQFCFRQFYRATVEAVERVTDEFSEPHFRWVRYFFRNVSVLGYTVVIVPFCPMQVYAAWMLLAALCYGYIVVRFTSYFSTLGGLVSITATLPQQGTLQNAAEQSFADEDGYGHDYTELEQNLQRWIEQRGYTQSDLISETLAKELGVTLPVFRAYFKEKHGTDFRQWRLNMRIDYACEIIGKHPDYSYDYIAEVVGIGDRSNFTKAFRKIMGMTPKEYSQSRGLN